MYLGRERLGKRKQPVNPILDMDYTDKEKQRIEETVARIKEDYPEFNDLQARIWEVISRYRGETGLSALSVSYLASAIYCLLKEE